MKPTPHPWSHGFDWQPPRGPFRRISAAQAQSWDERGFFVLEDAFDAATVARVTEEIAPFEAKSQAFLRSQPGGRFAIARADEITFTTHLVARSAFLRDFCRHPVFCDLVHDLVGPDVRLYWDQAVYKKPGTRAPFPWHQDNGYTFVEPQAYLTCWVALTDATLDNGCPRVVPGLHRGGTLAHEASDLGFICFDEAPAEVVAAPVRAGGIVVFSSLTPHATGPNLTDDERRAYIVQFAPEGAVALRRGANGELTREPCIAPERQYPVLSRGEPVAR
ncbi:MAG TPA: phytanoyl-CoA dioxygenase family protein [Myxococcota bacterium]|nr:phytanoyl-CoA dioxygenase family protein [Myxococcota bacterium]